MCAQTACAPALCLRNLCGISSLCFDDDEDDDDEEEEEEDDYDAGIGGGVGGGGDMMMMCAGVRGADRDVLTKEGILGDAALMSAVEEALKYPGALESVLQDTLQVGLSQTFRFQERLGVGGVDACVPV